MSEAAPLALAPKPGVVSFAIAPTLAVEPLAIAPSPAVVLRTGSVDSWAM